MPSVVQMVVCREAVVDRATNIVSLHGLIEEAQVLPEAFTKAKEQQVMAAAQMAVYALLSWEWPAAEEREPLSLDLRLCNPAGIVITLGSIRIEPAPSVNRFRAIFNLQGFPLGGEGIYTFELLSREKILGKVPFRVISAQSVAGQPAGDSAPGPLVPNQAQ